VNQEVVTFVLDLLVTTSAALRLADEILLVEHLEDVVFFNTLALLVDHARQMGLECWIILVL